MARRRVKISKHDAALLDLEAAANLLGYSAHRLAVRVRKGQVPPQVVVKMGKRVFLARPALTRWLNGELPDAEHVRAKGAANN